MQVRNYCPTEGQSNDKYRLVYSIFIGNNGAFLELYGIEFED